MANIELKYVMLNTTYAFNRLAIFWPDALHVFINGYSVPFLLLGPISHPAQLTFYTDACIVASLHRRKADFPPQQPAATTLAPGEACR